MKNDIAHAIEEALEGYFTDLDGEKPAEIYKMVLKCVEKPLVEKVLHRAGGNQTLAAQLLGINRNTLRKKMQAYGIK